MIICSDNVLPQWATGRGKRVGKHRYESSKDGKKGIGREERKGREKETNGRMG
jgi:hypothetical protein